ncbi:murein biosynthesis integral membrane protein MurJ, partial [Acinetobacter baumannii]
QHMALALASSVTALVNAVFLYFYLHKLNIYRYGAQWKKLALKNGFANLAMIAALWFGLNWYNGELSQWISVAVVVGLCVVGVIAYLIGLLLTGFR